MFANYPDVVDVSGLQSMLGNIGYVSHKFKQILRNNDLREIRFHDLRHSCRNTTCKKRYFIKRNTRLAWTFKLENY